MSVVIKQYQSSMNEDLKKLEITSNNEVYYYGLVVVGRNFKVDYDEIINYKFQSKGFILVAEKDQKIVGKVCFGVKQVIFQQKPVNSGVIFDLRVDQKYQRLGIGKLLMEKILSIAQTQYNIELIYCSVNGNNEKSQNFFKNKFQFHTASERTMLQGLSTVTNKTREVDYSTTLKKNNQVLIFERVIDKSQILEMTHEFYKNEDMYPCNYDQIINGKHYLGCFQVRTEDQSSVATVQLIRDDRAFIVTIQKFLVDVKHYRNPYFHLLAFALISIFSFGLLYLLHGVLEKSATFSSCVCLGIIYGLGLAFIKLVEYIKVATMDFVRIISPTFKGNSEIENDMFQFLLKNIHRIAYQQNCMHVRVNLDINNRFVKHFNQKNDFEPYWVGKTYFLAKYLVDDKQSQNIQDMKFNFTPDCFFDFRDI